MLETYYRAKRTLADFRRGPLGPHFDGFADYLMKRGYCDNLAMNTLGRCCAFNYFLVEQGITSCQSVSSSLIGPFLTVCLPDSQNIRNHPSKMNVTRALKKLFAYLIEAGIVQPEIEKPVIKPYSWMMESYLRYLREDCERAEVTIGRTRKKLIPFLDGLGKQVYRKRMKSLKAIAIEEYVKKHIKDSRSNIQFLASTLRGFLRFCASRKYTAADLSGVIPTIPSYRLVSLPQGIEETVLQRILKAVSRDTPTGFRDYAILLVMMAYGIRGKQAAELLLEDINWERSTIRIRAMKGGKETLLPLLESVGEAILSYLRHRPENSLRQIFLSTKAPFRPLTSLGIGLRIRTYMSKAGAKMPGGGSRVLRHSWAIRALAQDNPMKAIADVLGHRCLDTTFIYAKADLKTLRHVVTPWVGVKS